MFASIAIVCTLLSDFKYSYSILIIQFNINDYLLKSSIWLIDGTLLQV